MLLHTCTPACQPGCDRGPRTVAAARQGGPAGRRRFTVDLHAHVPTPAAEALVAGEPQELAEPGLPEEDAERILGRNTCALLGLPLPSSEVAAEHA